MQSTPASTETGLGTVDVEPVAIVRHPPRLCSEREKGIRNGERIFAGTQAIMD